MPDHTSTGKHWGESQWFPWITLNWQQSCFQLLPDIPEDEPRHVRKKLIFTCWISFCHFCHLWLMVTVLDHNLEKALKVNQVSCVLPYVPSSPPSPKNILCFMFYFTLCCPLFASHSDVCAFWQRKVSLSSYRYKQPGSPLVGSLAERYTAQFPACKHI